jgi:hypothetical protein
MRACRSTAARSLAAIALAGSVLLSAQQIPDEPAKAFGSGVTGAFLGWFDNPDGSSTFVVGYLNRNRAREVDVPIGMDNRIEPGGPDRGQPTHFLTGVQTGVFAVTVPRDFGPQQSLTWTISANGQTNSIPLRRNPEYLIAPLEEASVHNSPPTLHLFDEKAAGIQGPIAELSKAVSKATSVSVPLSLPIWAEDDAKYTTNTGSPMARPQPPVTLTWSKYRGPGQVTLAMSSPPFETLKGGRVNEPYRGRATATATFSAPGEYVLHVTANDYSGVAGRGFVCCWTTALVKVSVTP